MPLEDDNQRRLVAAQGFLELGLPLDANAELEEIDADMRNLPEVLAVRLEIYRVLGRWELMQTVAKRLSLVEPHQPSWIVSLAEATREVESAEAAYEILQKAAESHPNAANLHYKLACYGAVVGDITAAKHHISRAFELNKALRLQALDEKDLRAMWDTL
ncbi:MAG: hypothetical protein RL088_3910 [Verrucomicrobiota bacterium]